MQGKAHKREHSLYYETHKIKDEIKEGTGNPPEVCILRPTCEGPIQSLFILCHLYRCKGTKKTFN